MNKAILILLLILPFSNSYSAPFPYKSAIFKTITDGGVFKHESETYITFSKNPEDSLSAEWASQEALGRVERSFNLTKDGVVYHLDLDTNQCTKTNIQVLTDRINDPERLARQMKQELQMKPAGNCKGGGYEGTRYTHSFGEMCLLDDVFMLWQKSPGATTEVTEIRFDVRLPEDKITLPSGVNCVPGPDLSKGIGGMMSYGQSNSATQQNNSQGNTSGGSTNQQQPSQEEMEKMQKQATDMMKNLGKSLEGLFPQQE
ncbi:MAG: hypothetical protein KJP11_03050 [Gammaproteobacteria bacterium]|nr:hypothetical protein [Gammaproteobacteria bacterium]